jgi:protein-S-isoprenylcysteine O-methyltransferase Ste14
MIFREARAAGPGWNVAKTMAQVVVFWGTLLFLFPWLITGAEARLGIAGFPPQRWLGGALFAVASAVGLAAAYTMAVAGEGTPLPLDHPRRLVVRGPYGVVRNPMAVAGIAQGCAVGFFAGSYGVIAYSLSGALAWHFGIRPFEERHLRAKFGEAYEAYRRRVGLWIPRRGGARGGEG